MTTALIILSIVLGSVGVLALAAMHFAPQRLKGWIDGYQSLISFNPFK